MEKKLIALIDEANLSAFEHSLWMSFINMSDQEMLNNLSEEINDPKKLKYLTKNMTDKVKAFRDKDSSLWDKIIEEEKQFLKAV